MVQTTSSVMVLKMSLTLQITMAFTTKRNENERKTLLFAKKKTNKQHKASKERMVNLTFLKQHYKQRMVNNKNIKKKYKSA